jgi:BirA family biotin operon repressor/biotin-[acetyl-CoA-carboxylase] ligase
MSDHSVALISLLSDGAFHSGEKLGKELGVSRAAIWKVMHGLESLGLEVHAVSGKGYRLSQPLELLNETKILEQLGPESHALLTRLELKQVIDSTNAYLVKSAASGNPGGIACFAEFQRSGRGRRGRQWASPYGRNLYLSLLWRFQEGAGRLGGLSLAVAVALMRALTECGLRGAGLKWPNDILVDNRKLAGILLELAGESNGPCYGVIGLGINFDMPDSASVGIDQPWTDLRHCGVSAERNVVAGRILHHLLLAIPQYLAGGLDAFREEWNRWDLMTDQSVEIRLGEEKRYGVARGIDDRGLLLVQDEHGLKHYSSGEVSLRVAAK